MTATAPRTDVLWARWFFRLVQLSGVGIGVHESLGAGRFPVLAFAAALILGVVGVRGLLRSVSEISGGAEQALQDRDRE